MKIKLFKKEITEILPWAKTENETMLAYIKVSLIVNRHVGFVFCIEVMNKSFNYRNPFKALLAALESETVGMGKYDKIKERLRENDMWKDL